MTVSKTDAYSIIDYFHKPMIDNKISAESNH